MFIIDDKYKEEFSGKINQIFCYITSRCNSDCVQCLYKPMVKYSLKEDMIEHEMMINLLKAYRELGAIKVTFIGGEPTLNDNLPEYIKISKELGYQYIRIDTNGLFDSELLEDKDIRLLDEITISLDDYDSEINDEIRGRKGYFQKCISNIKRAQELGFKIQVTCCIHKKLTIRDKHGRLRFENMVDFAEELGLDSINFHTMFKANVPRDTWSGNIHTTVDDYLQLITDYNNEAKNKNRKIHVRFPQGFVSKEEFDKNSKYYDYCPVKIKDRALISHDGTIRTCALMLGTAYYTAYFDQNGIHYNSTPTNEMLSHKMNESTPCTHQSKRNSYAPYVPTCISFKPNQNEIVWLERLNWEKRRID